VTDGDKYLVLKVRAMTETLAVLALDAADLALARRWDCANLLLSRAGELETFSYSLDTPFTPEVWTTVATGLHPDDHGVKDDAADWDSVPLRLASLVTQFFPSELRSRLGQPFRERGHRQEITRTEVDHAFTDGTVFGWPGISDADHLSQAWSWASDAEYGDLTDDELRRNALGNTGKEVGWLVSMAAAGVPIAGVHAHALDLAGHIYARREEALRAYYEHVDDLVGMARERVERLVVLSDHGMGVSWLDDPEPGTHSDRAMVAATDTVTGDLPASVYDVREWLEANAGTDTTGDEQVGVDTARERLEELGYIE
jgi:hypothetical protein